MTKAVVKEVWANRLRNQAGTREFAPCTAWVNFDGTGTVAIRDSLSVSSITDNGVGLYTINFDQAMDNTNYSVASSSEDAGGGIGVTGLGPKALLACEVKASSTGGALEDCSSFDVAVFGGITL